MEVLILWIPSGDIINGFGNFLDHQKASSRKLDLKVKFLIKKQLSDKPEPMSCVLLRRAS